MTHARDYACLCFDSSYVLAEVLENKDAKTRIGVLAEYQKDLKLDTYLPPTVKSECEGRMRVIIAYVGNLIRDFEHHFRNKKSFTKASKISLVDIESVREFFAIEITKKKKSESEIEILKRIETMIVRYMWEKLGLYGYLSYFELMTSLMVEILKYGNLLREKFNNFTSKIKPISTSIDNTLLRSLMQDPIMQKVGQRKPNDLQIICETAAHQKTHNKWTLLVTLDARDFIDNAALIDKLSKVKCVDPLYVPELVHKLKTAGKP